MQSEAKGAAEAEEMDMAAIAEAVTKEFLDNIMTI